MTTDEFAERVFVTLRRKGYQVAVSCDIHLYLLVQYLDGKVAMNFAKEISKVSVEGFGKPDF